MRTFALKSAVGAALIALLIGTPAMQATAAGDGTKTIVIEKPWARASIMLSRPGVAYMTLVNKGAREERLLEATTPLAGHIMIHESVMVDGVVSMRHRDEVSIAAGQSLKFEPGGLHLMLMKLKQPLRQGEELPLMLRFEHSGIINIRARIVSVGAAGPKPEP